MNVKAIIQSGIKEVVYLSDKYSHTDIVKASKLMMTKAGVSMRKLTPSVEEIKISLDESQV